MKVYRRRVQLCDLLRVRLSPNDSWDKLHPLRDLELDKRLKRWTDGWFVTFVTTQQRHEDTLWDVSETEMFMDCESVTFTKHL